MGRFPALYSAVGSRYDRSMENEIRIKFSRIQLKGKNTPCYSIYSNGKYQGDVYTARDIEPFIASIPVNA